MPRSPLTREIITAKREAAFWLLVSRGLEDACWLWLGRIGKTGYGQFSVGGREHGTDGAHRIAWVLLRGEIPPGMCVMHDCPGGDNRACVNPRHLLLGTDQDNARDASRKGTLPTGSKHWANLKPERVARGDRHGKRTRPESIQRGEEAGASVLTEAVVVNIRREHASGASYRELGRRYGVHYTTVARIVRRQTWRHVV